MDVDGGVELGAPLVQVDDGLDGQRPCALGSVEGEVPPLAAGVLALEPQRAAEDDPEGAVRPQLGERAVLVRAGRAASQLKHRLWSTVCKMSRLPVEPRGEHSRPLCPGRCRS